MAALFVFPANGSAGIGTTTPDASSILEMKSTTQGMLVPRMTKAQRDAIASPATGLLIYQTDNTPAFYYYSGSAWTKVATGFGGANKTLNNLTSPTSINVNLLPQNYNSVDLGSSGLAWKDIYSGGDFYIDGFRFISNGNSTSNVFVGNDAGKNSTVGGNTAVGNQSLLNNSNGFDNTAIGAYCLSNNTLGYGNTAIGNYAMNWNTGGYDNTALGRSAMSLNKSGINNTALGNGALSGNISGSYNIALGGYAGDYSGDNSYCTFIGYNSDKGSSTSFTNSTTLGSYSIMSASNQVRIGSSSVTSIGGYTNWSNISDGRVKKNIKENVPGLDLINKLKPVTYNLDLEAADKILRPVEEKDKEGKTIKVSQEEINARRAKEQILYSGFVAQEVEKAAKGLGYDFSGVDAPKNEHDLYGIRYAEFVVPLVKAVQELSKQNDELKKEIDELKSLMIKNTSSSVSAVSSNATAVTISDASLSQNIPNPFSTSTTIHYTLPQKFLQAYIVITDQSGKAIKKIDVKGSGKNVMQLDASSLSSGTYRYSLYVDEKMIDSKQMLAAK